MPWKVRLSSAENSGFCPKSTKESFGYVYPTKSKDKIILKCTNCGTAIPYAVGDFYSIMPSVQEIFP